MTKHELLQKLRNVEETELIDLLGLTSDEIVDAFLDTIEERYDMLHETMREMDNGTEED